MKRFSGTFQSYVTGWQAGLRSLLLLCVCLLNMALPYWHEHDLEEHAVSHVKCHSRHESHLHSQTETVVSHDHDHCAICQNALNHVFTACSSDFRTLAEKVALPCFWSCVREFVARVKLPIHPQAP